MRESLQLWLAGPDAAQHFDPSELTDEERERMTRLRRATRRQEFEVSRALRAHARRGAPTPYSESLAHSGGYAALARGSPAARIAVDLEFHRGRRNLAAAATVFTQAEMRALEAAPASEREHLFYAIWTVKEALAKVLQLPLMDALRACEVMVDAARWQVRAPMPGAGGVVLYRPTVDLTLAAAWTGPTLPIEIWDWPPQRPASWALIAAISL